MVLLFRILMILGVMFVNRPITLWANEVLSWEESLVQAAANHPDLILAQEQIRQSKDDKTIAASGLWPQVDASASVIGTSNKAQDGRSSHNTNYDYGLSGSQLLFDGFQTVNNVRASQENVKASQWNFKFVSSQVRFRLRSAFINMLKAQEQIKLAQDIYNIRRQNLDLITLRYNSGTEHRGALLTAQANLAQADFEIHQSSRNLLVAQRALMKEMGTTGKGPIEVKGSLQLNQIPTQRPDFEQVVLDDPQLLKLILQENAASFDAKSTQGNWSPAVSLIGGAGKSDTVFPAKAQSADVGVKLSWSLLEGGSRSAQIDRAQSILRGLKAQQHSLKDSLVVALEGAWNTLSDAIEQVDVQRKFLEAAEMRSKIAQQQYQVGIITYNDWNTIEDNLVSTKKIFLNTQMNALLAEANWVQAQGKDLEYAP